MNTEIRRRLITPLVRGLFVCLLGSSGFTAAATITEVEPNDSISSAQSTPVPPLGLTISAVIGQVGGGNTTDVDFFTFDATAGDTPSITIVGAMQFDPTTGACNGFSSIIGLYDALGNLKGQGEAVCGGSEAVINNVTLPATGTYFVAVSGWPHYWDQGGLFTNSGVAYAGGPYQLVIGGVINPTPTPTPTPTPAPLPSPTAKHVPIEVMHWQGDERDLEKRKGRDPIAVAILSMDGFDAMTVDPNSLTFGATGAEKSLFRCHKNGKDVNRDGRTDMVCYFKPDVANFQTGDLNGVLRGKTKSGQQIEGSGALKIFTVPTKKPRFKRYDHDGNDGANRQTGSDTGKK